jgi:nucleoside 2-deoxyribosyltransferase
VNIYIAGAWSDRVFLRRIRKRMIEKGNDVTARWLDAREDGNKKRWATRDLDDIRAADTFLLFPDVPSTGGGYHVETGYALALGKDLIGVGKKSNLFHELIPTWYRSWMDIPDAVREQGEAA